MEDIIGLFKEFDTDLIVVSDCNIITNGTLVDCITLEDNKVGIWAGNPMNDKYAEELLLSREERKRVLEEIIENF